jgi:hypothetical protein
MKPCPQCHSDQLKKASLVYEEGTGVAVGVGVSTHSAIGIGSAVTASSLALRCAPPKEHMNKISRSTGFAIIFSLISSLVASAGVQSFSDVSMFWKIWLAISLALTFRCFFKDITQSQKLHTHALKEYDRTYICTRCGIFSKPFE